MESPFVVLADLFGALARIFGDPEVQRAGDNLVSAIGNAMDREPAIGRTFTGELEESRE